MQEELKKDLVNLESFSEDATRIVLQTNKGKMSFFKKLIGGGMSKAYEEWNRDGYHLKKTFGVAYKTTEKEGIEYKNVVFFMPEDDIQVQPQNLQQQAEIVQPRKASEEKPDWDAIAEGKVRSLLVEALISYRGLVPVTEQEKVVLLGFVRYCMYGTL